MPNHVKLVHRTLYHYDRAVRLGPQRIRLKPMPGTKAPILSYSLTVDPAPAALVWQQDALGNLLAMVSMEDATTHLDVVVELVADLSPQNAFDFRLDGHAFDWPFSYQAEEADLALYLRPDFPGPELEALRAQSPGRAPLVTLLTGLLEAVHGRVGYIVREEPGIWTPDRTLREGKGSCRDSAWLLVQLLRLHGIAARFVSGYLLHVPPNDTAEVAELHAWAEAYLPGAGWIGMDASSGLLAAEGHVPLAASPNPMAASPMTGTVEAVHATLETRMALQRVP